MAYDSPDHLEPHGTAQDNSANYAFNRRLDTWINFESVRVLDLGCSGGGFVKSIIDQGGFAVGIEGSDYSKRRLRAEWASIPDYLFTADVTEPFQLYVVDSGGTEHPLVFNVITAWEFIEHIRTDRLGDVMRNITKHLAPAGVVLMSVSPNEEIIRGARLHQTVADKEWWLVKFRELGFRNHNAVVSFFRPDWVRGGDNAPGSFHVALSHHSGHLPRPTRLYWLLLKKLLHSNANLVRVRQSVSPFTPDLLKKVYRRLLDVS